MQLRLPVALIAASLLFAGAAQAQTPDLRITRGAISAPDGTLSPAAVAAPYFSDKLDATPVVSDVTDVDAFDDVRFAIVVDNRGGLAPSMSPCRTHYRRALHC